MWESLWLRGRHYFDYAWPHTYPGMADTKHTPKHNAARKARFKARHKR